MKPRTAAKRFAESLAKYDDAVAMASQAHDAEVERIRRLCTHEWVRYPDPAGGSDGRYICQGCNSEKSRLDGGNTEGQR